MPPTLTFSQIPLKKLTTLNHRRDSLLAPATGKYSTQESASNGESSDATDGESKQALESEYPGVHSPNLNGREGRGGKEVVDHEDEELAPLLTSSSHDFSTAAFHDDSLEP